jgi:uncharacterized protein YfkK (UPF0435 family)
MKQVIEKIDVMLHACNLAIINSKSITPQSVAEDLTEIKSMLSKQEEEGVEVTVYDEFKGVKYGTCNGRSKVKCGSDQVEGTEICEICGTKLIWPQQSKEKEG